MVIRVCAYYTKRCQVSLDNLAIIGGFYFPIFMVEYYIFISFIA